MEFPVRKKIVIRKSNMKLMLLFSSFPQIGLREPGKHVLAIAFFTPPGEEIRRNETKYLDVTATDGGEDVYSSAGDDGEEDASGQAYIFSCPYSSLCRQVVTDSRGRVAQFDFPRGDDARVRLGNGDDEDLVLGVDSIVAIPLQDWSIDYVTPRAKCTRSAAEGGQCVQDEFPAPPEGSQVISFVGPGAEVSLITLNTRSGISDIHMHKSSTERRHPTSGPPQPGHTADQDRPWPAPFGRDRNCAGTRRLRTRSKLLPAGSKYVQEMDLG